MFLIKYIPNQNWQAFPCKVEGSENQIVLSKNNWDDYGSKTSFNMLVLLDGKEYRDWSIKILIEKVSYSAEFLDQLCLDGWDGVFPIPTKKYVSLFSDIDFYKSLIGVLGLLEASNILKVFNEASYMKNILQDSNALLLIDSLDFRDSLLRGPGAHKSYEDAWKLFDGMSENLINDFIFNYQGKDSLIKEIKFNFSEDILPSDINVLIGGNGIGKTYTLKILIEFLLEINNGDTKRVEKEKLKPFDKRPNFSKIILISYSVFEDFLIDIIDQKVKDKSSYKYFGLRMRRSLNESEEDFKKVAIGKHIPSLDATKSIFKMIYENYQFGEQGWWINKFELAIETLRKAFDFDEIIYKINEDFLEHRKYCFIDLGNERYLVLNSKLEQNYNIWDRFFSQSDSTLEFCKNKKIINLSSGQKIFTYIVLNILGEIKKESLILIDEPELFLHPTLEIEFIGLLKAILKPFNSKAILATHSLSIVREIPSKCVHIYRENKDWGLEIDNPPFQTFGADMQRISTYVFGDKSITKPFEEWLEAYFQKDDADAEYLIGHLKGYINEEMIMDILRLEKKYGN